MRDLEAPVGRLNVLEDRTGFQLDRRYLDAAVAEQVELVCVPGDGVDADQRTNADAEPRGGECGVRDRPAQAPATRVGWVNVASCRADDEQVGPGATVGRPTVRTYTRVSHQLRENRLYFYELSESDDEILANLLLAHDAEYDEGEFLDMVLEAREAVLTTFEDDSLIEAIAGELERRHGFVHVEANLRAAVRVSVEEGQTAAAPVDERAAAVPVEADDFRTMLIEVEPEDRPYRD